MDSRNVRRIIGVVAALVGAYLLHVAADPGAGVTKAFWTFVAGVILFVATAWALLQMYRPGEDVPAADESPVREWTPVRFLRRGIDAAPLYLGLRLFLAWEWIDAARHKLDDPAWMSTGAALRGYWQRAVSTPAQGGPPITYPAYRSFIQFMLDHDWYTWFAKLIAVGELLIGIGLLVGGVTGIAAIFGLLMNFSYIYAGTVSSNPTMIILEALIAFLGWRVAGYYGLDRWLLRWLGTPWSPGRAIPATEPGPPPREPAAHHR